MNILDLLVRKTGKGIAVAAKDTGKAAEKTGKVIVKNLPTVAAVAAEIALPIAPELSPVFSVASKIAGIVGPRPTSLPVSNPLSKIMAGVFQTSLTGDSMNPLEAFAITLVLGTLQTVVKNPAHRAALQSQLVGLADDIYTSYGLTVPSPSAANDAGKVPAPASH